MHQQRGSVIISAIFIALLVALIGTSIALFSRHLIQQAIASKTSAQTEYLLDAPIPLIEDEIDRRLAFTHSISLKTEQAGVTIRSYVSSTQGLLNINHFTHLTGEEEAEAVKNLAIFLTLIGVKQNTTE